MPVVWNGKLHLLGTHRHWLRLEFDGPCRLRAEQATRLVSRLPEHSAQRNWSPDTRILHVTSLHADAATTDELVSTWSPPGLHLVSTGSSMAGDTATLLIAYGGETTEFERIRHPHKFFVPQSEIWASKRGGPNSCTYLLSPYDKPT